ncbi:MAG TPA: hypothetical protein VFU07_05270 [Candidatus Lumbricidophila sp.]|nr:hypothetical protein [Candidatus Lumbricidophila sp.]
MALLTKKRSGNTPAHAAVPPTPAGDASKRKRRENERLRSVLKESTFGAAIEALESNVRFRLLPDADGNSRWLALLLHAESIGGLSEKTNRDEAKGSLVQQIVSNQIEAISTAEMLEREFFAIVPSGRTLERMAEFSLLTKAQYHWIVFSSVDGELKFDQNIGEAGYQDAVEIQNGGSIQGVITAARADGEATWARIVAGGVGGEQSAAAPAAPIEADENEEDEVFGDAAVETAAAEVSPVEVSSEPDVTEVIEDVLPDVDDDDFYAQLEASEHASVGSEEYDELADLESQFEDDLPDFEIDADELIDSVDAESEIDEPEPEVVEEKTPYTEYVEANKEREFSDAEVRSSIARRFLADDLELTVDLDEFDAAFARGQAPAVNVAATTPADSTDWLGNQVAQIASAANSELETLRRRHDEELRQLYIDYTSRHIEEVVRQVSVTDPTAKFGEMMLAVDKNHEAAVSSSHARVTQLRQEIDARFTDEANQAAEAAAMQARLTHTKMNHGRREAALAAVDNDVNLDIRAKHENERQQVLRVRRADAELGMQQGKSMIFQALAEVREKQSVAEARMLSAWNERLIGFIDENRKVDIVRAEALVENLSRANAVEEERKLSAERLEAVRADHADRVRELEQRAAQIRADAEAELAHQRAEWQSKLEEAEARSANTAELLSQQERLTSGLHASIAKQYEDRLDTLRVSRQAVADELELRAKSHTRLQRIFVLLLVLLVVAGLAIGAIAGWIVATNLGTGAAHAAALAPALGIGLPGV